ncbi:MAG TPA: hypothetical protein VGS07_24515 [Thermoanaerobaculia bacterium]|jgi:hypothetical protein|nr:hypothetical protein [Thermoanaerobaculia bacterium]
MPRTGRNHTVGRWTNLTVSVTPEIVEKLPMLKPLLPKLIELEADVDRLVTERDFYQARKQETSRKIQDALVEGRKVAHVIRVGLRHLLGDGNEGLVAFGIKPFRGKKRSRKAKDTAGTPSGAPDETPDTSGGTSA